MNPKNLANIERAILSVQDELVIMGLDEQMSLSDIEAYLMEGWSLDDIVTQALLMQ